MNMLTTPDKIRCIADAHAVITDAAALGLTLTLDTDSGPVTITPEATTADATGMARTLYRHRKAYHAQVHGDAQEQAENAPADWDTGLFPVARVAADSHGATVDLYLRAYASGRELPADPDAWETGAENADHLHSLGLSPHWAWCDVDVHAYVTTAAGQHLGLSSAYLVGQSLSEPSDMLRGAGLHALREAAVGAMLCAQANGWHLELTAQGAVVDTLADLGRYGVNLTGWGTLPPEQMPLPHVTGAARLTGLPADVVPFEGGVALLHLWPETFTVWRATGRALWCLSPEGRRDVILCADPAPAYLLNVGPELLADWTAQRA